MTEKCFDEGTIQAFLDGELDTDTLENVARHTAVCDACALLLQEAEEESAFAFSALESEFNTLVPTERIRTNLYDAIAQIEKPRKSFWQRIFGDNFSFSNPSVLGFASLLLVFGLFTALYINRESQTQSPVIARTESLKSIELAQQAPSNVNVTPDSNDNGTTVPTVNEPQPVKIKRPIYKPNVENQAVIQNVSYKPGSSSGRNPRNPAPAIDDDQKADNGALLGEESYVKTIATLTDSVNAHKDTSLRPSERFAFEKDLAVVDDAITKMQKEVRRNPKNEAAKQVLRASYQNKIDLLNSVADKSELMAAR